MGAAGRDFHDFQVVYRDDPAFEVVAFTATQIPGIDDRTLPRRRSPGRSTRTASRSSPRRELPALIRERDVDQVVFAYSDIAHVDLMHKASLVLAAGADFVLLDPDRTMIPSHACRSISVCAVRTGVGKSGISKRVAQALRARRPARRRHPPPHALPRPRDAWRWSATRRSRTSTALDVTIEEREEYEHLVEEGVVVYAGVDYEAILRAAEKEADVIIWDGGNNDTPFYRSDLEIVALDPHRPGHERLYHPGETNFLRADVLVVNKVRPRPPEGVVDVLAAAARYNPNATVV